MWKLFRGNGLLLVLLISGFAAMAQSGKPLKGKITDAAGQAIPGASIQVKGTSNGTASGVNGQFTLTVPDNAVLVISAMGFASREIPVAGQSDITVALEESSKGLDEVVVVGYGTQKKGDVTSAISTVNTKNLSKQPSGNIGTMLQGQAAGVIVSSGTGNPAANPTVLVRGLNSINNDNPLYVVDGIPQGYAYDINPNDIESVSILKDASAATIYGARAAGGVIIITTKKGKSGEPRINFNSYVSMHRLNNNIDLLDKFAMNKVVKEAYANDGSSSAPPIYVQDDSKYANSDWVGAYMKKGVEQKHDVDVSGASEKISYRLSLGHWEHSGNVINSGSKRDNIRLNTEIRLMNNRLKISPIFSYTRFNNKNFGDVTGDGGAGFSPIMNLYNTLPHKRIFDASVPNGYAKPEAELGSGNPVGEMMLSNSRSADDHLQFNIAADLKLWKGFSYNFSAGRNIVNTFGFTQTPAYDFGAQALVENPSRSESRGRTEFQVFTHLLNYEQTFGKHNVKAMYGFSREKSVSQGTTGSGNHLSSPLIESLSGLIIDGTSDFVRANGWNYSSTLQSYFGRVSYNYNDKYFLQGSLRRDGSSKFGPLNRYGTFYSVSGGWNLHNESFFDVPWISELKPRFSYGSVGNQNVANFQYLAKIYIAGSDGLLNYPFGSALSQQVYVGAIANSLANNNIKWEQTSTLNAGLSYSFLKGAISGSFDYFQSRTSDMLAETPIPSSSGITAMPLTNIADMENKGWELTATYRQPGAKAFYWDVTVNLSHSRNKIIRLGYDEGMIADGFVDFANRGTTITRKGEALASFYLYKSSGIFRSQAEVDAHVNKGGDKLQPNAAPGDLRFDDTNGDGELNDEDKQIMGNGLPKLDYGVTFNAAWKNFDLMIFLNGKQGQKMYNGAKMFLYRFYRSADLVNAWSPSNSGSDIYRLSNEDRNENLRVSDYFLEDASFLRLRNLQLGYTLPQELTKKAHVDRLRIYAGAFNLLTFTKYTGFDPDLSNTGIFSRGVDRGYYPMSRSFVVGVNVGF
ncbi:SusC/RagA family TonB-linked outer membrane protein [Chitinophaga deserti]|uniref:SusC/RagA family TonB-linked outer membrane protein n=1 Tax=Chitinophaga deserti TaxID=2164099 RepID=UPI000D6AB69F|nr:TonB-dependent receptor [Chitinophaga deserti]